MVIFSAIPNPHTGLYQPIMTVRLTKLYFFGAITVIMLVLWIAESPLWAFAIGAGSVALWLAWHLRKATKAAEADQSQLVQAPAIRDNPLALLDGISEPAIIIDQSLTLHRSNPAARSLFGTMRNGEPVDLYLRHPAALEAIRESIATRQLVERELNVLSPMERSYTVRCNPVGNTSQNFLILLHDITKLKLADRMRADFVANASHELRTPLATLIGFIETLQGQAGEDDGVRERFLGIMSKESGRMARLIDDLLSLSRIEMDKHVAPVTPIDLRPVLRDVGSTLAMRLDADSRFIDLKMPEQLPSVMADRDQILQVLHNLVSNALKYGKSGTPIDVTVVAEDNNILISVADHGEGIAPEHLPRLTERFYRIDTARSRELGGTGLGLAIVKHIVERHRGELQIRSHLGQGTTVSFSLPRSDTHASRD
jgi:two-component system, OmpR family, phosphate regulon sensor histidine kinase PhoR